MATLEENGTPASTETTSIEPSPSGRAASGDASNGGAAGGSDADTRARLLAVAGPVFAHSGFERATVREISRIAKVNLAAISYHFGDKMGLYLEVIRDVRKRRECSFPLPSDEHFSPDQRLRGRINLLLSRMLVEEDERNWETQLLMREMQQPTAAFKEMVEQAFKPMMDQLCDIFSDLMPANCILIQRQKLAFSVIGQCLYYRVAKQTVRLLIPEEVRKQEFSIEALTEHITHVTLAAAKSAQPPA